jgi:pimeloyl-ACP methyl ester carboxylesterase
MKFPPPGRMLDIGGRKLHIQISGPESAPARGPSHGPTVILESGLAATSLSWANAQPRIAKFATVVSYDRAGLGWSDDQAAPATALNAACDLRALVEHANLPGPYIFVGHSFGGLIVRVFQQEYPDRVAGLVLVDPVRRSEWSDPARRGSLRTGVALSRRGALLARLGVMGFALGFLLRGSGRLPGMMARAFAGPASGVANRLAGEVRKIPREFWPAVAAHWSEERSFRTMADYLDNLPLSISQLDADRGLGELPLVVLSAANATAATLQEHLHDAKLSTNGEHMVVSGAEHWINLDAPETVADAVRRVWREVALTPPVVETGPSAKLEEGMRDQFNGDERESAPPRRP